MSSITRTLIIPAMMLVGILSAMPASALEQTWVSATGSDDNPCTRARPCASFKAGVDRADAGGEGLPADRASAS